MKFFIYLFPIFILIAIVYLRVEPNYGDFIKLSKFSEPAYGVFWYEPRFRYLQRAKYEPYPEMPNCDRLRFVYKLSSKEIKNATK